MSPRSRWWGLVLALFPQRFRREFGEEFVRDLGERRKEERFRGPLGSVRWTFYLLRDLGRALPRVHGREWRARGASEPGSRARASWAGLSQDVRTALRGLRRQPSYFLSATVTLGVGIGASTAIFGIIDGVVLRPLPYEDPEELVELGTLYEGYDRLVSVSPPDFRDVHERTRSLEAVAASRLEARTLLGRGEPRRVEATGVSAGFFELLGVAPRWGRSLTPADDRPGAPPVAVVSHAFWRSLGSPPSPEGIGILRLDEIGFTVIGVLPEDFHPPEAIHQEGTHVWYPLAHVRDPLDQRGFGFLQLIGRLAEGTGIETARSEMAAIGRALSAEYPENGVRGIGVEPLHRRTVGEARRILGVLLGAVGFLLLIACVNAANLSLVRATHRSGELFVRRMLGAGRRRILRLLGAEAFLIAAASAALAVVLAHLGVEAFRTLAPNALPRMAEVGVDGRVLAFAVAVAVTTTFVSAVLPAWLHREGDGVFVSGPRTGTPGRRAGRLRATLVVAETALALVLLTGAGVLAHSLLLLTRVDPGFDSRGAAYVEVRVRGERYADDERRIAFFTDLEARLAAIPGVEVTGATNNLPLDGNQSVLRVTAEEGGAGGPALDLSWHQVTPGYFHAAGIEVVRGRAFDRGDRTGTPPVAVVNRALASRVFPGRDPLGSTLRLGTGPEDPSVTIVGVVGDVRQRELGMPPAPELYLPFRQSPRPGMYLLALTEGDPEDLLAAMRQSVRDADPEIPVAGIGTLEEHVTSSLGEPRFHTILLSTFAAVALLLAFLGIYGTTRFTVERRMREMGIRMALGADRRGVRTLVVGGAMRLVAAGLVVGALVSVFAARTLETFVFGIEPVDPLTLVLVALALASAGLVAAWLPARRATSLEPARTLREA